MLTDLFCTFFRMSLYGAAAVLLVWSACMLLRRIKAPRSICCMLWLAVLLCFLCPAGIPVQLPQKADAAAQAVAQAADQAQQQLERQAMTFSLPDGSSSAQKAGRSLRLSWPLLLGAGWLAGAAGMALYALAADRRLHRRVALAYRAAGPEGIRFYTGSGVDTPFVAGLFSPRIYLPAGLPPMQQRYILLHEQAHLRRRDNWLRPLFYAALCLHWYNPLAWAAYRQMVLDMEAACDESVVRQLGEGIKPDYCQSLLRFALHGAAVSPLAFGESNVKARIRSILDYRRPRFWAVAGCLALAGAVGFTCLMRPAPAVGAASGSAFCTAGESSSSQSSLPESAVLPAPAAAVDSPSESAAASENAASSHQAVESPAAEKNAAAQANPAESKASSQIAPAAQDAAAAGQAAPRSDSAVAGENDIFTGNGIALLWPVPGYRYCSRWLSGGHKGVDIAAREGADILAAADGTVVYADYGTGGYGYTVLLSHGNGLYTLYAHCYSLSVESGQTVAQGQQVATVGSTGKSTGNHCHLEILECDDVAYLPACNADSDSSTADSEAESQHLARLDPADWFAGK